ncbi:DNA phosphorothioation system restriction enzyme [Cyanobacterium stanieri LEGE 03274]|uniref:DNA phosphorothioation system restriction enzyme n=1 Tax=Cyanobacterium stanieri LEGE 03274 TaxID=1828756 RepID=A0ABR9V4E8_9CHRO|nr:DNA phosphorothioation system restriction enzyme [Cyanobacterium stanieri]MBE9222712.1 DNA phosphorothioation system restriction enzyme [Cyanobacterium stanieri LEGE 03274]
MNLSGLANQPLKHINWQKLANNYQQRNKYQLAEKSYLYQTKTKNTGIPKIPDNLNLRDYQKQAITNWLRNRGRGTLKMATGSGKTITALGITNELYQQIGLQVLLVICPFRHLVLQWAKEAEKFNLNPFLAFNNVHNWHNQLSTNLYNINNLNSQFLTIITTNSTFISENFQSQLPFFPEKTLIIGDEAHNLGSTKLKHLLPKNIGLRLALSATPERYYDEDGTDTLISYFGKVLQPEFTLADAIKKKALVSYNYYPIFVQLTESETQKYTQLTKKIGWELSRDNSPHNRHLTALLVRRSRLIGTAKNKLIALKQLMRERIDSHHTIFYCGDGKIEYQGKTERQLEIVTRILGKEIGYRVNIYSANTPLHEREIIKKQLEKKELQGIVAIRCLDEGIDIPIIKNAVILASSSNPRQFIQRRGRVLRPHPSKKEANIFDMIVTPPTLDREIWEIEKNLLKKEIKRFIEFANLANNANHAKEKLFHLQNQYDVY